VTDQQPSAPIRPAATVMLLRNGDGPTGIEVFMLRRTLAAAFGSGMYVFPGGKVEAADGDDVELAHRLAAIRECFEEAGVLLAHTSAGEHVSDGHPVLAARTAVHDGTVDLVSLCDLHELVPAIDELVWVSHWITPRGEGRRFDTRFYVAPAPAEQSSVHDDHETIASLWVDPADALARQSAGELTMMPPTITNLRMLAGFASVDAAMDAARTMPPPTCVLPKLRRDDAGVLVGVSMPGDADYDSLD
jgi:8-oxo-dGTP pyrophosphatase MutT (NUDIX family)